MTAVLLQVQANHHLAAVVAVRVQSVVMHQLQQAE
jgi:hypothetical protein